MNNKLDYLAQKEEELRRMNDQLDAQQDDLNEAGDQEQQRAAALEDTYDANDFEESLDKDASFKGKALSIKGMAEEKNPARRSKVRFADVQDEEEEEAKPSSKHFDAVQAQLAAIAGGSDDMQIDTMQESGQNYDYEEETNQHLEHKYKLLLDKFQEQDKTVQFQKAKIAALQTELEESLSQLATESADTPATGENKSKKSATADSEALEKKLQDRCNQQALQVTKLKTQLSDQEQKILQLERGLKDQSREMNHGEQEIRKVTDQQGNKEAKLNRALEEVEKYKLQLREAKIDEAGKNEQIRRDLDKMSEENKKLERQRNELLQAFKKQMKLIDVLKRQKMHIESAKLLAFTEDEFVKTLELGDKL